MAINRTDIYEKNLSRIHEWIRSSDQKISIFLTLQTAIIVFLTPMLIDLYQSKQASFTLLAAIALTEAYFFFAYGIVKSILGLYARLKAKTSYR